MDVREGLKDGRKVIQRGESGRMVEVISPEPFPDIQTVYRCFYRSAAVIFSS
jgi:hypothetical protein